MKRKILNLFTLSVILTTIGLLMDGDRVETSMSMRFTEYFAMMAIIFSILSTIYFTTNFLIKKFRKTHG